MINGVRNFKLINGNGTELDLTRAGFLLWKPDGLGWGITPTVTAVGSSYIVTDTTLERPRPTGSMVFANYQAYQQFLSFIQVGGLVLAYKPISTWYYLDCTVVIDKSEIKPDNDRLICPVDFYGTSQWYEKLEASAISVSLDEGAKIYPYKYQYRYSSGATGAIEVQNGNLSSYFKLTIMGAVDNPVYTLYQGGVQIASGKINVSVPAGRKLVIDTHPATMQIAEYTTANVLVGDRYANSDFTTERLFALPAGLCTIQVNDDGGAVASAFVEVRKRV